MRVPEVDMQTVTVSRVGVRKGRMNGMLERALELERVCSRR